MMQGFQIVHRNYGHWDVIQNYKRIYRIRGASGAYFILPENFKQDEPRQNLKTVSACMSWICDNLMYE